ncbi:hypothetical protein U8607_03235 [Methylobacterium durans]|uniref:hypothetical protein n=1 Tax=Methylobacterium durans TaxID=2202825 RepID=UPI002AFEBA42|nr:hypothetical protein [Methylobacterium durans]MEA1831086.1 hypothetical protein [Methylobacterium durans]
MRPVIIGAKYNSGAKSRQSTQIFPALLPKILRGTSGGDLGDASGIQNTVGLNRTGQKRPEDTPSLTEQPPSPPSPRGSSDRRKVS